MDSLPVVAGTPLVRRVQLLLDTACGLADPDGPMTYSNRARKERISKAAHRALLKIKYNNHHTDSHLTLEQTRSIVDILCLLPIHLPAQTLSLVSYF